MPAVATVSASGVVTVVINTTAQLTAKTVDANGTTLTGRVISSTSSDPSKATVSPAGLVSALAIGATTITATSEGKTATALVTVSSGVNGVSISPQTSTVLAGQIFNATAVIKAVAGVNTAVKFVSSGSAVATVTAMIGG